MGHGLGFGLEAQVDKEVLSLLALRPGDLMAYSKISTYMYVCA